MTVATHGGGEVQLSSLFYSASSYKASLSATGGDPRWTSGGWVYIGPAWTPTTAPTTFFAAPDGVEGWLRVWPYRGLSDWEMHFTHLQEANGETRHQVLPLRAPFPRIFGHGREMDVLLVLPVCTSRNVRHPILQKLHTWVMRSASFIRIARDTRRSAGCRIARSCRLGVAR